MLMRALGRLIMVPLGFILAATATIFILVSLGSERFTHAMHGRDVDVDTWLSVFDTAIQAWSVISVATLVPAVLLVIVGEVARIRSSLYYIVGGGAVLAAAFRTGPTAGRCVAGGGAGDHDRRVPELYLYVAAFRLLSVRLPGGSDSFKPIASRCSYIPSNRSYNSR